MCGCKMISKVVRKNNCLKETHQEMQMRLARKFDRMSATTSAMIVFKEIGEQV